MDRVHNLIPGDMRPPINHQDIYDTREDHYQTMYAAEQPQTDGLANEMRKKKGPNTSVTNDQELRKLFTENHHRDLKEVAAQVLANERGPRSEKTKQIFAMNW